MGIKGKSTKGSVFASRESVFSKNLVFHHRQYTLYRLRNFRGIAVHKGRKLLCAKPIPIQASRQYYMRNQDEYSSMSSGVVWETIVTGPDVVLKRAKRCCVRSLWFLCKTQDSKVLKPTSVMVRGRFSAHEKYQRYMRLPNQWDF